MVAMDPQWIQYSFRAFVLPLCSVFPEKDCNSVKVHATSLGNTELRRQHR